MARASRTLFAARVPEAIRNFLAVATAPAWLAWARANLETLLLDHANCEKKAASTAIATLFRYPDNTKLVRRMSRLAREELRHFEQVSDLLERRAIRHRRVPASRYAGRLRDEIAPQEPARLRDTLICGAYIEARSCERFAALIPVLDAELAAFYASLLTSEARHFENYLALAAEVGEGDLPERLAHFRSVEADAVSEPDLQFSFHSGPPVTAS